MDRCKICHGESTLDNQRVCRLCRKQGTFWRRYNEPLDLVAANRHGQQLFLADMFYRRDRIEPPRGRAPQVEPAALPIRLRPPQLVLFDLDRDLSWRGYQVAGLTEQADPSIAAAMDQIIRQHATQYGWTKRLAKRVRTGVRVLLAFHADAPGQPITATDAAVLAGTDVPMSRVLDVLDDAGLLIDDRSATLDAWFDRQVCGLPEGMVGELRQWFDILRAGSPTPPRRRPRSQITARLYVRWALPALHLWAGNGFQSLREISSDDVRAVLPPSGNPRSTMGQALRSIFRLLKAHKVLFTNPINSIKTGYLESRQPLPLDVELLRNALNSPDPTRAVLIALVAFHGLRSGQLRNLKLQDLRDGRLHIDGRVVLLADPVRVRVSAYLDYRTRTWPNSANPHLFLTIRSASGLNPAGKRWIKLKIDVPGAVQAIREDRILSEAQATGGDIRQICDMFGLSVTAAQRYAATVDHPDLVHQTEKHWRGKPPK